MTSIKLHKIIIQYQQNISFELWISRQTRRPTYIYACEFGTVWKFTAKEWWQEVMQIIHNNGEHEFPLSKALRRRPRSIRECVAGQDAANSNIRCVNPKDWTLDDWKRELLER
jgi:hypothetical protein